MVLGITVFLWKMMLRNAAYGIMQYFLYKSDYPNKRRSFCKQNTTVHISLLQYISGSLILIQISKIVVIKMKNLQIYLQQKLIISLQLIKEYFNQYSRSMMLCLLKLQTLNLLLKLNKNIFHG